MKSKHWEKAESEPHYLVLEDPEGWWKASIKWDGCINLNRVHNVPLPVTDEHPQLVDYIHICELDDMIERLEELRDKAREHFGEDWG